MNQPKQALRYLDDAARHAHMESDEWEAKAHFLSARAQELLGDLPAAHAAAGRSLALENDNLVYAYELARYCALTNRPADCAQLLERVLRVKEIGGAVSVGNAKIWWAKIEVEKDFEGVFDYCVNRTLLRLEAATESIAEATLVDSQRAVEGVVQSESLVKEYAGIALSESRLLAAKFSQLEKGEREGYFKSLDIIRSGVELAEKAAESWKQVLSSGIEHLNQNISVKGQEIVDTENRARQRLEALEKEAKETEESSSSWLGCIVWGLAPLLMLAGLVWVPLGFVGVALLVIAPIVFLFEREKFHHLKQEIKLTSQKSDSSIAALRESISQLEGKQQRLEEALSKVQRGEYL
jgi:hypothetical protein